MVQATQGLALYLEQAFGKDKAAAAGVCIGWDHRAAGSLCSERFALIAAEALLAELRQTRWLRDGGAGAGGAAADGRSGIAEGGGAAAAAAAGPIEADELYAALQVAAGGAVRARGRARARGPGLGQGPAQALGPGRGQGPARSLGPGPGYFILGVIFGPKKPPEAAWAPHAWLCFHEKCEKY